MIIIGRICSNCNIQFKFMMETVATTEMCPHCNVLNHIWIEIIEYEDQPLPGDITDDHHF